MSVYNKAFYNLESYTYLTSDDYSAIGFGLGKMTKPHDDIFFEELYLMLEIRPRHLYKISHYENTRYGDLWACYISVPNSYMNTKRINDCFIVAEIDGELKIIANFGPDINQPKWKFYGGDRELKMNKLGKLLSIDRIMEPVDDTWSMEQYNKEI